MKKDKDNFWKIFWSVVGVFAFFGIFSVGWLKFLYFNQPEDTSLALAIGITFDANKDPFARTKEGKTFNLVSGYLYQDSIPFGFEDWSWDTETKWRTVGDSPDSSYSIQTNFLKAWAGIRLNSPSVDIKDYNSITLEVKPDVSVGELYIDLYDRFGQTMGKQSLGWYTQSQGLLVNQWNKVQIPLSNLLSKDGTFITGFSISSKNGGSAVIDSVRLVKDIVSHDKWVDSNPNSSWLGSDPFTGTDQLDLPYKEMFTEESVKSWKNIFGLFELKGDSILIGPVAKKTTGGVAVFGGGKNWRDYHAEAKLYWGMTSTFSLLARFQNDSNFVSCAYSNYGSLVQLYVVVDGESTLISQTPLLATKSYEPWKDVLHGIEVQGDRVSCFMDGEKVLSANLPQMKETGTLGLETWTQNSNDYPHKLLSLTVKPL